MLQLTTNVSIYHQCVGTKTALLQAEASARVSGLRMCCFVGWLFHFSFILTAKLPMSFFSRLVGNGYVYETFGISKHFPVKLQVLLIRAERFDNPLTAKCFIYDVGGWLLLLIILIFW